MKKFTKILFIAGAVVLSTLSTFVHSQSQDPLNASMPYLENWDSGIFTNWSFDPNQGNWSISQGTGNPAPSVQFSGSPAVTTYAYSMESQYIDATNWTCATIWLDFDYKLVNQNVTSTEKIFVEVYYNETWNKLEELVNNANIDWTPRHFDISAAKGQNLKIRFIATGANSANIQRWYIDNIHVYGLCNSPTTFQAYVQEYDTVTFNWIPPECGPVGVLTDFIYDDGSYENGWTVTAGYEAWEGNEFPLTSSVSGVLKSFTIYFIHNEQGGLGQVTIDIFDSDKQLIGSSAAFQLPEDNWITVDVADIPFDGKFYGMVHWNHLPNASDFLGYDQDGPHASENLEWLYDGYTWLKFSDPPTYAEKGVFLLRAKALVYGKIVEFEPGKDPVVITPQIQTGRDISESVLTGYNIYRTDKTGLPPFLKLNTDPIMDPTYTDIIGPDTAMYGIYKYYATAVFSISADSSFLCESPSSDTVSITLPWNGIAELAGGTLLIHPNPFHNEAFVDVTVPVSGHLIIEISNLVGQEMLSIDEGLIPAGFHTTTIDGNRLSPGIYVLALRFNDKAMIKKIVISH